ncbi:acyl-CoA dehydrogenase family protein [Edaphosphingomonas haloaromaticamans]|uniref:Acryloyl-CoA reductase (NADH) n=1 Tax=Edaphosphingomonas haloaromaticamans TaxID=653954 RepID=A0A1S1HG97_9SPHN|nr:acyl-CoA dehydrogenase family protein [Sphingomonas haloaromaticamans]OHT20511.1 Acryloyl-CoA reductase (NADH) [Sphingomonas haloaromaticamans]
MAASLAEFRDETRTWLEERLNGPFKALRGLNNHVDMIEERRAWEQELGQARLSCIGWPSEHGGRDASIAEQVVFAEEYARAHAPSRIGHIGIELAGPTIIAYGTEEQKARHLPGIARGEAIWCQGYSEPNAGSDLANVRTRARLDGDTWIVDGQKIWTSMGSIADWIFVVARSEEGSKGPKGLSFLLMPMDQPGITVRPIRQMTGESEFAEVFFDGAVAQAADLVGRPGDGWAVAMGLLGFERGVSTLVQQMHFQTEMNQLIAAAKANGRARDPLIRQRIADAWTGLSIMRFNALRMLNDAGSPELDEAALTSKLYWSRWHRDLGDLAMDVLGVAGEIGGGDYRYDGLVHAHLMSRSDTIYAGSSQIQRNIIAERGLGLPREPRGDL